MSHSSSFRHIPQLDGVRAIAVLLVMFSHAGLAGKVPGGFGVTIFFFLSGYLITSLLRIEFAKTGKLNISAFYLRRVLRIMPPLYITLVILTALYPFRVFGDVNWPAVPWDYLFLSNYSYIWGQAGGLPVPLWSLAVEEHFYLFAPVALAALMRRKKPASIAALCAAACLVILIERFAIFHLMPGSIYHIYYSSHTRLDSILFGCCLALYQNPLLDEHAWRPTKWQATAAALAIIGTFLPNNQEFRETVRYSIQGMALFVLFSLVLSGRSERLNRLLIWPPLRWIGVVSYSLYLCHVAIYDALGRIFGINPFEAGMLGAPIALLYAQGMRTLVELPIARWRRRHQNVVKSMVKGSSLTVDQARSKPRLDDAAPSADQ